MINPATFIVENSDIAGLQAVVAQVARLGYQEVLVRQRLGLADLTELRWRALPIIRDEKLAGRDALALAIDLFLLQGKISRPELDQLFDRAQQELLVRAGLLAFDDQNLAAARASLFPVNDSLIFSDHAWPMLPHPGCEKVPPEQVMYIGADSRWLARTTICHDMESALDLCTGSGVHALLAARQAKRVVAVDINPRAVRCTQFNAAALGLSNVEATTGDLFEPVTGEKFDLITANPPFVPSPVEWLGYRDGGKTGEEVQRRIIAGLPAHLSPGGTAQIVTEFGEREGENLADRLRQWLNGAAMDIYVLRLRTHSASSYAIGHAGNSSNDDTFDSFLTSVQQWAANLRNQGYTRIVSVLLAFQWSDPKAGEPWTRSEESSIPLKGAGKEVEAAFAAERQVRDALFTEKLAQGTLRRAGPMGLFEARFLGSELPANAQVKLLNRPLSILQVLDTMERDILWLLEKPVAFADLVRVAADKKISRERVVAAVISLIQKRLVLLS